MALTKVFDAVTPMVKGRIIVVFGSAGRRDELKRPIQGEIAGRRADIVILTEEDDRDQDGLKILEEIAAGAEKAGKVRGKNLLLIHEREAAVEKAINLAKPGDLVLLLGKGEERVIYHQQTRLHTYPRTTVQRSHRHHPAPLQRNRRCACGAESSAHVPSLALAGHVISVPAVVGTEEFGDEFDAELGRLGLRITQRVVFPQDPGRRRGSGGQCIR